MKQIYEMKGRGHSARSIARELGLARNTVLRYLDALEGIKLQPRPLRHPSWTPTPTTLTDRCPRVRRIAPS